MHREQLATFAGRELRLTNLDKVLYPATGTTKGQVIEYLAGVAQVMVPHLLRRPATRKRWPDGVTGLEFFAKDLDPGTPAWLGRVQIDHDGGGPKFYPLIESAAALIWCGQIAALELHVPQWRIDPPGRPREAGRGRPARMVDRVVIDLDPGPGVGLAECAQVAFAVRDRLGPLGARSVPVTSGSKGIHVYVPMDTQIPARAAADWAQQIAAEMVRALPELVVDRMSKALRTDKVLVDWSQNHPNKTTISPYSLRGREQPTVAAPRTWAELADPDLAQLDYRQVLDRVAAGLDPLASLHQPAQQLAAAAGADHPNPSPRTRPRRPAGPLLQATPPRIVGVTRPQTSPGRAGLPAELLGPVEVMLAKAQDELPGPHAMAGGTRYEPKWDGYRASISSAGGTVAVHSRQRRSLSQGFPEIVAAAAARLPADTVADGEICIWGPGDRLSFDLLQQRLAASPAKVAAAVATHPATFLAFDLLALRGVDLRGRPYTERRAALEELARDWAAPLQLTPVTDSIQTAREWIDLYRASGVEGLVCKGATSRYTPGIRGWVKHKVRKSEEIIIGAVIGDRHAPDVVVAGRYRPDGTLVIVGRTSSLTRAQSRELAGQLERAGPDHPWPDTVLAHRFSRGRDRISLTKVQPTLVAEISADTAQQGGVWRHSLRYLRIRCDLTPADVDQVTV